MLKVIAGWLAPQMKRDAQAYDRMMLRIDEARWWLAAKNPECSALAQFLIDKDAWYWSREVGRTDMAFCPPDWVTGIDSFRAWIETDPFRKSECKDRLPHDERGFEIIYQGDDGWSDWLHPQPGYRMACCDCGLVHDMEFQLVRQDQIDGMNDEHRQPGETKRKAILFRARRVSEPTAPKPVDEVK